MTEDQTNPITAIDPGITIEDIVEGALKLPADTPAVVAITKMVEAEEAAEHTPTPEEAREMFAENPGLWAVLTTEGTKLRGEC